MAQQTLNIGLTPDDGTGDLDRVCFDKTNQNFNELYALSSKTLNAADPRFAAATIEQTIDNAINLPSIGAIAVGASRLAIPATFLPFDASLVRSSPLVRQVREGGDWTVYDIRAYGAAGDGSQTDNIAAAAMYAALPSGVTVSWPPGTYRMHFATNGAPLVTIGQDNIATIFEEGAVLRATAASAVTTKTDETNQYVFYAKGHTHLSFSGGTFDGNRDALVDPDAAFFYGLQCSSVHIANMEFKNSSNAYGGLIYGEAYDGTTSVMVSDWVITGCTFRRSSWCTKFQNLWYAIEITDNYFENLDLEAPQVGYSKLGSTAFSRAVRFSGYVSSTSASGPIGNAVISGNRFNNAAYAIEVWNQDATNGRNPDSAELISIQNNTILSIWGIGVNSYRDVTITGNAWKRLKLSATQMLSYAGISHITDTSVFGAGIEARPGYGFTVSGNTLDGQWVSGESPDLTGSDEGIELGNNGFNVRCEATVNGNTIQRCFTGISCQDLQNSTVENNLIRECRGALGFTSGGTNSFGRTNNVFRGNYCMGLAAQAGVNICVFRGGWVIESNYISGDPGGFATAAPFTLADTAGVDVLRNNTIVNFLGAGIRDNALDSTYDSNTLDSKGSTSNGSIDFGRQNNKVVRIGTHNSLRCSAFFGWANAAGTGETYTCGIVYTNAIPGSGQNRSISSGTIADMNITVMGAPSGGAPGAGAWSAGTIIWRNAPTASNPPGDVCVTSGSPGTWKTMANLSA